jgi:hypothetical protein
MNIVVRIPEAFASRLAERGEDLERQALEALALETYRAGRMTKAEMREALGFAVADEVDGFLKAHAVYESYDLTDLERDRRTLDALGV